MRYYFVMKCLVACEYNADVFTPCEGRQKIAWLLLKAELQY